MSKNKNKKNEETREINLEESNPVMENPESTPPEPASGPALTPPEPPKAEKKEPPGPKLRYFAVLSDLLPVTPVSDVDINQLKGEFPLVSLAAIALERAGCEATLNGVHLKSTMSRHDTNEVPEPGALVVLTMGPPDTDEVVIFLNKKEHAAVFGTRTWSVVRMIKGNADRFEMAMNHRTLEDGRSVVGWVNVDARNKGEVQE